MIKRIGLVGFMAGEHLTCTDPFVLAVQLNDIPRTVCHTIDSVSDHCKAVYVNEFIGWSGRRRAEAAARRRNVRIIWGRTPAGLYDVPPAHR